MNKSAILKNLDDLSKNPMFMLSLTSRELFHSNFWAWILRQYPQIFTKVFYEEYDGKADVKINREKNNFDLSLQVGDEFIIIENKIKSMPNKEQLEKYWAKAKTDNKKLVLVSYFKPLFSLEKNWNYLSYEDLCNRLQKSLTDTKPSSLDKNDEIFIVSYIKFLELLNQFQENMEIKPSDKMGELWEIIKDKEIQDKLNEINFEKTFQRAFMSKITLKVLEKFKPKDDFFILLDCGRDLKVYSDILIKLHGAWSENSEDRQDLNFLGVSLWGKDYRYYAGINKQQCGISNKKDGRQDSVNKQKGYDYLAEKYPWFFNKEENQIGTWGGYSDEEYMYLYKKMDISEKTIEEITQKTVHDLNEIYERIIDRC